MVLKHSPPAGGGGVQRGVQNVFGSGQRVPVEHGSPVQANAMVSKQPPSIAPHCPSRSLQTPVARRSQSLPYVVPSQPQTGL
jgi:hypothetical protein